MAKVKVKDKQNSFQTTSYLYTYILIFFKAKLIDRGDKLDVLVDKTEDLSKSVSLFIK